MLSILQAHFDYEFPNVLILLFYYSISWSSSEKYIEFSPKNLSGRKCSRLKKTLAYELEEPGSISALPFAT